MSPCSNNRNNDMFSLSSQHNLQCTHGNWSTHHTKCVTPPIGEHDDGDDNGGDDEDGVG